MDYSISKMIIHYSILKTSLLQVVCNSVQECTYVGLNWGNVIIIPIAVALTESLQMCIKLSLNFPLALERLRNTSNVILQYLWMNFGFIQSAGTDGSPYVGMLASYQTGVPIIPTFTRIVSPIYPVQCTLVDIPGCRREVRRRLSGS